MTKKTNIFEWLLAIFVIAVFLLNLIFIAMRPADSDFIWVIAATFIFSIIIFSHIFFRLGLYAGLLFVGLTAGIGFLSEYLGVNYYLFYGRGYIYNPLFGPTIGQVPIAVIVTWTSLSYICYLIVRNILPEKITSQAWGKAVIALSTALLATGWDLAWDPLAVKRGVWTWREQGPYFGVPISNFIGWVVVIFLALSLFQFFSKRQIIDNRDRNVAIWGFLNFYIAIIFLAIKMTMPLMILIATIIMMPFLIIIMGKRRKELYGRS